MASSVGRYTIVSPATSQLMREVLVDAIDNGTRTVRFTAVDESNAEIEVVFTLAQARYRQMVAEYVGTLSDGGSAVINVMTHPDLCDTPARLTLVRRVTP